MSWKSLAGIMGARRWKNTGVIVQERLRKAEAGQQQVEMEWGGQTWG